MSLGVSFGVSFAGLGGRGAKEVGDIGENIMFSGPWEERAGCQECNCWIEVVLDAKAPRGEYYFDVSLCVRCSCSFS